MPGQSAGELASQDMAEYDIYLHRNYWTPCNLILSYGISAASLRYAPVPTHSEASLDTPE